ncbi:MAG: hypothetical protein CW346_15210 [Bacillaceae bacterium]|nr:hypothetical protein [Bacillaceae bacterium]
MIVTFEVVRLYGRKQVKCQNCGRRVTRSKEFSQTINPFNKNADGEPKNRYEITAELRQEREEWLKQPELCRRCKENGGEGR